VVRRNFGSVRKLPSGRWQARYPLGPGHLKAAPSTFATKAEATRWLSLIEADIARGQFIDPYAGQVTVSAWAERWLARPGKRAASIARDRQGIEIFIRELGQIRLSSLTAGMVQSAVDARAKIAEPATLARDFAAFRALVNAAVDADMIGRSPVRKIALPKKRPPQRQGLTATDLKALLHESPERYRALVLVGAVLGLRWGEAIGLRIGDVDFMRRTVTVAQTVEELAGQLKLVPQAKTHSSLRTIAAPAFVINAIAVHIAQFCPNTQPDSNDLIFLGPRGGILRRSFVERILRPAGIRAGLETTVTFHALRHSAVTAMAESGIPYNVTQHRVGHATARLTMELYSHKTSEADRAAAKALESHFGILNDQQPTTSQADAW
jgi:integrase